MTRREILDAMGPLTTDAEAKAMQELLAERGITDLNAISEEDFLALIPLAIERAAT
jgi:hypothetical protein